MAQVATIQLLVDTDDPTLIKGLLTDVALLARQNPGVIDVRFVNHEGAPLFGDAPIAASSALEDGTYENGKAFEAPFFVLPTENCVQVDPFNGGTLHVRFQSGRHHDASDVEGDIDLRVVISDEGVQVHLLPGGVFDDHLASNAMKASLTYDAARRMQSIGGSVAPEGVRRPIFGRLFDAVTSRPVWPAALVPARLGYEVARATPSGYAIEGALVEDTLETGWRPMNDAGGVLQPGDDPGFITDDGELIGEARVVLQAPPAASSTGDTHA